MWMNAAEVMFLRAEAALRGWDTEKTPKAYYEAGIRLIGLLTSTFTFE